MADVDPGKLRFGPEIMARLEQLGSISHDRGALSRHFLTPEHKAAGELIKSWMEGAGMQAGFDAIGNVVGRYEGVRPGLPTVLTGSHFDTVRNAGKYDGMLGVVTPIACVKALHEVGGRLPFAIEVIGFADEEGVRFNSTLLGSRAVAGTFDPMLLDKMDAEGITMAGALHRFGLDPARVRDAAHNPENVLGYVELHVEPAAVADVLWESEAIAVRRKVKAVVTPQHAAHASPCAPWIMEHIAEQIRAEGIEPRFLASGAGHDGMAISDMTGIGMLFVRCGNGGISHHPAETMTVEDADLGARIFLNVLRNFKPKAAS